MSSSELSEWMAFEQIEPFESERQDLRIAILGQRIVNTVRGLFGLSPLPFDEFMLNLEPSESMTNDQIWAALERHPFFTKIES